MVRPSLAFLSLLFAGCLLEPASEHSAGAVDVSALEIQALGVSGFVIRSGPDAVLTAPLFSNPSTVTVALGDTRMNQKRIDRFTKNVRFDDVRAILSGHAHYDHLMDVPGVWPKTPGAIIMGNMSTRHLLSAYAPDRSPLCNGVPPQKIQIPRNYVFAFDWPENDLVDRRPCDGPDAPQGSWVHLGTSNVRVRALCSQHPPQFLGYHFGEGDVTTDYCAPPTVAEDWREGQTLAFLIDFLDPETHQPRHRIYYQDAPTDAPVGHVPADILAEKEVDVALLCVGTFDAVRDHPTEIIRSLQPRYVLSGHWESFFQPQDKPVVGLPFHDLAKYDLRATTALGAEPSDTPLLLNGVSTTARHFRPMPGSLFTFSPRAPAPPEPAAETP